MVPRPLTLLRMYELRPPATMGSYRCAIPSIISFHPTHYVAGSRPFTVPIEPKRSERQTNRRRNILLSLRIESRPRPGSPSNHTSKIPCERHVPPRSRQETSRITWDIPLISRANAYRDPSSRRLIPLPHHNVDHPRILPNETRHLSEPMHSTNLSIRIPTSASTRTYEGLSPGMDGSIFLATPSDSVRMFRDHLIRSFPPSRPLSWNLPFRFLACHRWPSLEPELRSCFPSTFEDLRPYFAWSLGKLVNDVPGR
ncbi:hypothetical protein CPAR01_01284 [Colletotrichum paranaense]|uniref:Uncharacterized protein n=2 Tax=Colletotrichum acutatum species complex TaxID=2707335 RepID=A0AAI9XLX1_9PEZI|nr:uncharacterized protein CPAR01_01284 [Colletotrichum paranaense]KAK1455212.1 hypothetical protein CMEL01_03972 [Colletotrichum melonis]KAK1547317.1 hypothetical protein CPAR01_01284 [Colletotrichum paranaense]